TANAALQGDKPERAPVSTLKEHPEEVPAIGEEEPNEISRRDMFNPSTTARVVVLWVMTPTMSGVGSFILFSLAYNFGWF
ncbi:MAG: inorganic phosphate transporter, partial [Halobacteria archaeon]|nr:inorganic phosphate transporter [Halobacteria archaeon]